VAWRGDIAFRHKYPRLFAMSNQKDVKVVDMLVGTESGKEWHFLWRR